MSCHITHLGDESLRERQVHRIYGKRIQLLTYFLCVEISYLWHPVDIDINLQTTFTSYTNSAVEIRCALYEAVLI